MPNFYEETKELLEQIEINTRDGDGGSESGGGSTLTPSLFTTGESGTVASGAQSISFYNYGPDDVSVAGGVLVAKHGVSFDGGIHRLGAVSYTIPPGTLLQVGQTR